MKVLRVLPLFVATTLAFGVSAFAQKSNLTGTVYDANGAVVVKAKVKAVDVRGIKFEALTNDEGVYVLTLPFNKYDSQRGFEEAKYDVFVESSGFKTSETRGYVFIPSQFGKMYLDIGLEIGPPTELTVKK